MTKMFLVFDPYKVMTFRDRDLREAVALQKAKASSVQEALSDQQKTQIFHKYMNDVPMAGYRDSSSAYVTGIEDHVPNSQYEGDEHRKAVIQDIADNWVTLSQNSKFHAILATSSIEEAIEYYRLVKSECSDLKATALFDPNIDYGSGKSTTVKTNGLVELLEDYNDRYELKFDLGNHAKF